MMMKELVEKMLESMEAENVETHGGDDDLLEYMRTKTRPPATNDQIEKLEQLWGRSLPPTYREFLKITNGLENFQGTHLLLGTDDHFDTWAAEQVESLSEFWDDYKTEENLPLVIPAADEGIRNLWTFEVSDKEELDVIDWDTGEKFEVLPTFRALLEEEL